MSDETPPKLHDEERPITRREGRSRGDVGATPSQARTELSSHPPAEPSEIEPLAIAPRRLGRFTLQNKLGEGGMGAVYAALDEGLGRKVAIKLLHARPAALPGEEAGDLLREAQALAALSHPNVVTIYDVGTHEGRVFMAMEHVEGVTLRAWLSERARRWPRVLEVFMAAGAGLAAAHARGIVHRDFKPENVLLGKDGRVRVLDFGLARRARSPRGSVEVEPGDPILSPPERIAIEASSPGIQGTRPYMAPEQQLGLHTDARTDQFAFCVAFWEALFGVRPFSGQDTRALTSNIVRGRIGLPPHPERAPGWLRRVVERGLARFADERHPSMEALLNVLADLSVETTPTPRASRTWDAPSDSSETGGSSERRLGNRYSVRKAVGSAGDGDAFRGIDRMTGDPVRLLALPRANPERGVGVEDYEQGLVRVFQALSAHPHPHVVTPLDLVFGDDKSPFLVQDLKVDPTSLIDATRDQPLSIRLNYVVQLLQALVFLHGLGLLHLQISSRSVGVVDGKLKLVEPPLVHHELMARGVVDVAAYLAPEALLGGPLHPATDLFSVGVLAFEVLSGTHPFRDVAGARAFAEGTFDVRWDELDAPPAVRDVIQKLVAASPEDRYPSARDAIAALGAAVSRNLELETPETRECVLRGGRFVGRESELAFFDRHIAEALAGRGGAVLVTGEGGVGKSRLLKAVRAHALVRGAQVVTSVVSSRVGKPFDVWHEPLVRMMLNANVDEHDAEILASVVAEVPRVLGRDVRTAPEVEAHFAHLRFVQVVARLLQRQDHPLVLLLEDLHAARSESVTLLRDIRTVLAHLPVLVIGTLRDDEPTTLATRIPGAHTLRLRRLPASAVTEFSAAVCARPPGSTSWIDGLVRETEGNPFFLVEILRAMAEDSGGLAAISANTSPGMIPAGGVRRTLAQRIERLTPGAIELLQIAAVCGRRLHPRLLEDVLPNTDVVAWLKSPAAAGLVDYDGQHWDFSHDRLRDALLGRLSADELRSMNERVAISMGRIWAGDSSSTAVLARHWALAGSEEKQAHYSALGGEYALQHGAHVEGAKLLEDALKIRLTVGAGGTELVRWRRQLADVYMQLGAHADAARHLAALLGSRLPRHKLGWVWLLVTGVAGQMYYLARYWWGRVRDRPKVETGGDSAPIPTDVEWIEMSRAAAVQSSICLYENNQLGVFGMGLLSVNLGERARWTSFAGAAMMGYVAGVLGLRGLSAQYFGRARRAPAGPDDASGLVLVDLCETASALGFGEIGRVRQVARTAIVAATKLGDRRGTAILEHQLAYCDLYEGRLENMLAHASMAWEALPVSDGPSSDRATIARLVGLALCLLGRWEKADAFLRAQASAVPRQEALTAGAYASTHALVCARLGDEDRALELAEEAMAHWTSPINLTAANPQYIAGCLEAFLLAWQRAAESGEPSHRWSARAVRLGKEYSRWAKACPVGESLSLYYRSRIERQRGRAVLADRLCERAASRAHVRGQLYFEALAHYELARHAPLGSSIRTTGFERAASGLEQAGAHQELSDLALMQR